MSENPDDAASNAVFLDGVRPMRTQEPAHMEELVRILFEDSLEGLGDKTDMDQALAGEWDRCTVENTPLTILTISAGPFSAAGKSAHRPPPAPSLCARAIAAALKTSCIRPRDRSFQLGGENFAAILPGTGADGSRHVTGHILWAVRELQTSRRAAPTDRIIPVAIGAATAIPAAGRSPAPTLDDAMRVLAAAGNEACTSPGGVFTSSASTSSPGVTAYGSFFRTPGDADCT